MDNNLKPVFESYEDYLKRHPVASEDALVVVSKFRERMREAIKKERENGIKYDPEERPENGMYDYYKGQCRV